MSVINTMLKDLEQRGAAGAGSSDNILGGLSANRRASNEDDSSNGVYLIGFFGLITLSAILAAVYYLSPYQLVSVAQDDSEIAVDASRPAALVETRIKPVEAVFVAQEVTNNSTTPAVQLEQTQPALIQRPAEPSTEVEKNSVAEELPVAATQPVAAVAQAEPAPQKETIASTPIIKPPVVNRKPAPQAVVSDDNDDLDDSPATLLTVTKQQRDFTPEEKSRQAYAQALKDYNHGNKQQAKSSLTEALGYSSLNVDVYKLLAVIYLEDGRTDLASDVIEKGLKVHTKDQKLLRLYLQTLVQAQKYNEAIVVMERRLQISSPDDLGYLAGLYQKNNDHLNAVKVYAQALQVVPSKSIWWMGQGISFEVLEKYKEALMSYQQSLSTGQLPGNLADYAINRMNLIKQHKAGSLS